MHASGKLILRLCGGVCNKQRRWKVRVVVELDPGFCFMVNKPHECPDVPQLLKRFFLAPYTDPDAVAMNFFRLVALLQCVQVSASCAPPSCLLSLPSPPCYNQSERRRYKYVGLPFFYRPVVYRPNR